MQIVSPALRVAMIVEPASPEPSGLFGHRSELGPGGISFAVLTLLPTNSPMFPTTPGLALQVSMSYVPFAGTVHLYQTEAPPALSWMFCSPGSSVAPTLVPLTDPEVPVITCAWAKLSLAGGGPDGGCGVIGLVGRPGRGDAAGAGGAGVGDDRGAAVGRGRQAGYVRRLVERRGPGDLRRAWRPDRGGCHGVRRPGRRPAAHRVGRVHRERVAGPDRQAGHRHAGLAAVRDCRDFAGAGDRRVVDDRRPPVTRGRLPGHGRRARGVPRLGGVGGGHVQARWSR